MIEEWRDVVGYEGKYQVSNIGRVRSLDRKQIDKSGRIKKYKGRIKKQTIANTGYFVVSFNTGSLFTVHSLVAKHFCANKNKKAIFTDHIDGNKLNNVFTNLELVEPKENNRRAGINGLMSRGNEHYNSKLTAKDVIHIRDEYFKSEKRGLLSKIARGYRVNPITINDIIKKRTWKHV